MIPPPTPAQRCRRGAPAWMVTFADMMTLLLCLFALLLTFAEMDAEKYRDIARSMRAALGGDGLLENQRALPPPLETPAPATEAPAETQPAPGPSPQELRAQAYADRLRKLLDTEISQQKLTVERRATEIIVRLQEKASFPSGSAELEVNFAPILGKLAQAAREIPGAIIVTGHTDDRPIAGARFRSNWELSAARAATVVEALIRDEGVNPARLEARGMAEHRPLAPNITEESRAQNRRVEISFAIERGEGPAEPATAQP
ncbi:MAG: flagellar motor protein MotB [Pseudomonadota bacterium]